MNRRPGGISDLAADDGGHSSTRAPRRGAAPGGAPPVLSTRWPRDISLDAVVRRKTMRDLPKLARSIDERGGLIQPVVITAANELIAGQRRLAAWPLTRFRDDPIPVYVMPALDSILAGERDENAERLQLTPSEQVALADALRPQAEAAAKERQREHAGTAPGRGKVKGGSDAGGAGRIQADAEWYADDATHIAAARLKQSSSSARAPTAADRVAVAVGCDRGTLAKAAAVVAAARDEPEKYGRLVDYMDKTGKVDGPFRRLRTARQVEDIAAKKASGKLDLPAGVFDRLVVDYPWPHEPGRETPDRATLPYATMPISDGMALPVAKMCAENCVLFLWTTGFHMQWAYALLRAWGFVRGVCGGADILDAANAITAPCIIAWIKDRIGKGQRLRNKVEFCIVAIKGKPVWNLASGEQTTELRGPVRVHSQKPDEFYALIDAVAPAQRSCELFARRELPCSWQGFGDQMGSVRTPAYLRSEL